MSTPDDSIADHVRAKHPSGLELELAELELAELKAAVREYLRVGSMASYRALASRVGLTVREG